MMRAERGWWAAGLWGVAGVPIVSTFVQAIFALTGIPPENVPLIGALSEGLQSLAVFATAARVFEANPDVVPILFIMIAVAWLAEGGMMFGLRRREYAYAAAGFVTLFLLLFLLSYLPLFSAAVPAAQLGLFVSIAVVTAAASWGAVYVYDWTPDLAAATAEYLQTARSAARDARQRFDDEIDERFDQRTRDRLRDAANDVMADVDEQIMSFRAECDDVLSAADDVEGDESATPRERARRAEDLASRATDLAPDERAETIESTLRARLTDALVQTFGRLHVVSRYGTEYRVRNLTEYNSVSLDTIKITAQVGGDTHDLGERLAEAAKEAPIPALSVAVKNAQAHIDDLESTVEEQEASFDTTVTKARERVETAETEIEAVEGAPRDRLAELLLKGRYESDPAPGPAAPDVEEAIIDGKDALHDCDFNAANDHAKRAADIAGELIAIAEFFRLVAETIANEGDRVPLPSSVDPLLARTMKLAFERESGVEYTVTDEQVELSYPDEENDDEQLAVVEAPESDDATADTRADPSAVVDEVLFVLRELVERAESAATAEIVELQTEKLPKQCTEPGVLESLAQFGRRQRGVTAIEIQRGAPPGYLKIEVADGESPKAVVSRIRERYLKRHGD